MSRAWKSIAIAVLGAAGLLAAPAQADERYPSRAIRLVVPFPAGGVGDIVARVVSGKAATYLGQPIVVDNIPGANSVIGSAQAARAKPDGYTLLQMSNTNVTIPYLQKDVPFKWETDFRPVVGVGELPQMFVVPPKSTARSVADLVAQAKAAPDGIFYGSGGAGTLSHLMAAQFVREAKVKGSHVPFKGAAPVVQAVVGDQITFTIATTLDTLELVKAGQLRALGVTSPQRLAAAPDVPTLTEQGYLTFNPVVWYGYVTLAKTPTDIVDKVHDAFSRAMADPDVQQRLAKVQFVPRVRGPAEFGKYMQEESARARRIIEENRVTID